MAERGTTFVPAFARPLRIPERVPLEVADPPHAVAGQVGTWRLPFRLAEDVEGGAELILQFAGNRNSRQVFVQCQADAPSAPGYVTAATEDGTALALRAWSKGGSFALAAPPQGLRSGSRLIVTAGDGSGGSTGVAAVAQRRLNKFFLLHRPPREGENMGSWSDHNSDLILGACAMHVLGGPTDHIHAWAPSQAAPGEELAVLVRPEDEFHNLSSEALTGEQVFLGDRRLDAAMEPVPASTCLRLRVRLAEEGVHRLRVVGAGAAGEALTNPVVCRVAQGARRAYWGMIHGHSEMSDGMDSLDNYFHQLRNECGLDFGAPGDHDHLWETPEAFWRVTCGKVKQWHAPGEFATFLGYEWAKWRKNGDGDRNVYYLHDDRPIYRSDEGEHPTPPDLFKALAGEEAIIIPHHTGHAGNFCDWKDHDPVRERLVEIYQVRGSYECPEDAGNPRDEHSGTPAFRDGYVRHALALGWRVGFTGGGDDHGGSAGTGQSKDGLMCVFAADRTRPALWDGMWNRRVVATTGARILLCYEVNGQPMGSELSADALPGLADRRELRIEFHGTAPVRQVDVIRNNVVAHTFAPGGPDGDLVWTDPAPLADVLLPAAKFCGHPFCFYYVRLIQEDGEMAWASPTWVDASA